MAEAITFPNCLHVSETSAPQKKVFWRKVLEIYAIEKAHAEYDKYKNRLDDALSPVEKDFIESIGMLEQISDSSKK